MSKNRSFQYGRVVWAGFQRLGDTDKNAGRGQAPAETLRGSIAYRELAALVAAPALQIFCRVRGMEDQLFYGFQSRRRFRHIPENHLQSRSILVIIILKNKNAAAYGCGNTHKPAQVPNHLHNGHRPHRRNIIRHSDPSCKGRVLSFLFHAFVLHGSFASCTV